MTCHQHLRRLPAHRAPPMPVDWRVRRARRDLGPLGRALLAVAAWFGALYVIGWLA